MPEVIHNTTQTARKEYDDDAYEFIAVMVDYYNWHPRQRFSIAELRLLVLVKQRSPLARKIMPGDVYVRQRNKMDGSIYTFKAKQSFHDLCCKHDLYPDY